MKSVGATKITYKVAASTTNVANVIDRTDTHAYTRGAKLRRDGQTSKNDERDFED
jgi:hypothetical protein